MSNKPEKFIDENGLRLDGRRVDEMRPMTIEIGVLSRADGSCYLEWGKNKVLAGVYGPRELHPRRLQRSNVALIRYRYNMAAFSVEDRARPGPSRRSTEISKVSSEAFAPVIMAELYPSAVIDVFVEVLQADAGTRTAAINAATIALAEAGIPMKNLVAACAIGKVDGKLVVDLNKDEDNYGEADLPIAFTQDGNVTLLQMDGNLTKNELEEAIGMAKKACEQIFELQREVLLNRFGQPEEIEQLAEEPEHEPEIESVQEENDEEITSELQEDEAEGISEEEIPEEEYDYDVDENTVDEEVGGEKYEQ